MNAEAKRRIGPGYLTRFIVPWPVCLIAFLFLLLSVRAEKFLTSEEAARVCFPEATAVTRRMVPITAEDKKRIEKESGISGAPKEQQVWIASQGSNVLGCIIIDQVIGKHDFIDYGVAVSTNGRVLQIEILEYREHYGDRVRDSKWREQFKGKTVQSQLALESDVYNISGATLSCRHVTQGVKRVLATYKHVVRPRLFGPVH